jgi:hypothetical protein
MPQKPFAPQQAPNEERIHVNPVLPPHVPSTETDKGNVGGIDVKGMDGALPQLTTGDAEELATSSEDDCEDVAGVNTIGVLKVDGMSAIVEVIEEVSKLSED